MSNKKREPREANDNPWYCLATLYGEQPIGGWDNDLAVKNRVAWNRWFAGALSNEKSAEPMRNGIPESDLVPLTRVEKNSFCRAFTARVGREEVPPDPTKIIDFSHTNFERTVSFSDFMFMQAADFSSAKFSDSADFTSAMFLELAKFESAVFSSTSNFRSAAFGRGAGFRSAIFFNFETYFDLVSFHDYADFCSTRFVDGAVFNSATFFKDADFINAEFLGITLFAHVRFATVAPDFRGAKMHEGIEWHEVYWPPAPQSERAAREQVFAYQRLRQEMERFKKHEDEQFFFGKELRARRGLMPHWSGAWLLNYLFEISSGYGQSLLRPTLWLLALFLFGVAVFAVIPAFEGARMTIPLAAAFSFANIFSFLPIKREIMTTEMVQGLSSVAQVVGVVQSLLGIVMLFLLGLALRSRFRMR